QQNGIEIIAKQVLDLISTTDSIRLSAAKNIELKVNGTAVRLGPDGFQVLTGGASAIGTRAITRGSGRKRHP
ncbi:DUF2345 domain-containing protein, partial [Burkholderia ubonensis]|uniref:DUF2345 domain-containing protein n=1 Tax=Burkholderia ubonensis TaxID=101571 RepID=UPI00076C62E9